MNEPKQCVRQVCNSITEIVTEWEGSKSGEKRDRLTEVGGGKTRSENVPVTRYETFERPLRAGLIHRCVRVN